jgi:hypothetical protein
MSVKITLSENAKRQIIFHACLDAKNKFYPNAIVNWVDDDYKILVYFCSKIQTKKKVGFLRKKEISEEHDLEIHCVEVKLCHLGFNDMDWGEIKVKSLHKDYDALAEEIAHTIEQYTSIILIINNPSKVESLQNPSRR